MDYPFRPVVENWQVFVQGLLVTIEISLATLGLSLALGVVLAFLRVASWKPGRAFAGAYVEAFRNVPPLVLLFFSYFALPRAGVVLSGFLSGVLALTAYHAAFVAEILRAGIEAAGKGQSEAARTLGLSHLQSMRYVILPQALAIVVPPLGNLTISLTKTTSLVATISVTDLMYQAQVLEASTFRTIEIFTFAGAVYLVVVVLIGQLAGALEHRLTFFRRASA